MGWWLWDSELGQGKRGLRWGEGGEGKEVGVRTQLRSRGGWGIWEEEGRKAEQGDGGGGGGHEEGGQRRHWKEKERSISGRQRGTKEKSWGSTLAIQGSGDDLALHGPDRPAGIPLDLA